MINLMELIPYFINSIDFINYLQLYNGLITAISTFILVIVTGIYVILTNKILKESEKTRKTMFLPNIKPTVKFFSPTNAFLEVRNVGPGAAANVQVKYWSDFNKGEPAVWKTPLMSPNETQELTLKKDRKWIVELKELSKLITIYFEIKYEDPWGEKHSFDYNLGIKDLIECLSSKSGGIPYQEKSDKKIVNQLKEISGNLKKLDSISKISEGIAILTDLMTTERVISFLKDNLKTGDVIKASEIGEQLGLGPLDTYIIFSKIAVPGEYTLKDISPEGSDDLPDYLIKKIK